MVKIDTKVLKEKIDLLSKLLSKHEEATSDLFSTIEHTSEHWKGDRSILFCNEIAKQKNMTKKVRNNLKRRLNIYQYVYREYAKFGKVLACDFQKKAAILQRITFSIEQLDVAINRSNNLDIFFSFSERASIIDHRRRLVALRSKMIGYQAGLKRVLEKVENIEAEVSKRVKELDEIKVEPFTIDN